MRKRDWESAMRGSWRGQLKVAKCYFEGIGVDIDYKEAVKWYELAAVNYDWGDLGINDAALRLAQCYREGLGVEVDFEKAAEWYDKAGWHKLAELVRLYGNDAENNDPDCPW